MNVECSGKKGERKENVMYKKVYWESDGVEDKRLTVKST